MGGLRTFIDLAPMRVSGKLDIDLARKDRIGRLDSLYHPHQILSCNHESALQAGQLQSKYLYWSDS
jgi:hypothetical protein